MRKLDWKKILIRAVWLLSGIGMIVLFGAAMQHKDQKACADVKVEITGVNRHMFIDEKDVLDMINKNHPVKGRILSSVNLRGLESLVEKNPWVYHAEMYVDNNQQLQVRIEERQPVARVFTLQGNSFYIDSAGMRLPLSDKLSARVPVFTGFPSDKNVLAKPDSSLLTGIVDLGRYIMADSFWMAQVAQVDITPQAGFEITPVIGDHVIEFGNAEDISGKFKRLYTFYGKAWLQNGMDTYEKLDVRYSNQVVAVKRGTARAMVDSAKAMQLLNGMIGPGGSSANDSSTAGAGAANMHLPPVKKTVAGKTTADSAAKHINIVPALTRHVKPAVKTNLHAVKNNKKNTKALSKVAKPKTPVGKQKVKKPAAAKAKAKAVMNKPKP